MPDSSSASFAGRWFDGRSAAPRELRFALAPGELRLEGENGSRHRLAAVRIAEPLRHAPRLFDLPDGSTLETDETPALAAALRAAGHRESAVVGWQSAWPASLVALVLLVAGSIWLYTEGLPRASTWAAGHLSPSLEAHMGDQALKSLDREVLEPSALSAGQRAAIQARVTAFETRAGIAPTRRLEFRRMTGHGANAFSLPGGVIVLLDELVEFTGDDDEMLLAVLAHEAGHQASHHMTRTLFRALGGAALAGLVWGDYSSVASHAVVLFGQLSYSRSDEDEADGFAIGALGRAGISPTALARFFWKLEAKAKARGGMPTWASTHPDSGSRADRAEEAGEAFEDAASAPSR
jgi:predicted Zn-dependent protease